MRKVDGLFYPQNQKRRSSTMTKPKTLEQLRAEKERAETQLAYSFDIALQNEFSLAETSAIRALEPWKYPKALHQGKNEKNGIAEAIPFLSCPTMFFYRETSLWRVCFFMIDMIVLLTVPSAQPAGTSRYARWRRCPAFPGWCGCRSAPDRWIRSPDRGASH